MTSLGFLPKRPRHTLRAQLLWRLVPALLAIIFVSALFSYSLALRFATEAYDTALFDSARSLAQQIRFDGAGHPALALPQAAQEILVSDPYDRILYRVLGADGSVIAGNAAVPQSGQEVHENNPVRFFDATVDGMHVRVSEYAVFSAPNTPGAIVLFAETLVKRGRLSRRLLATLLVPLVFVTGLVTALVWFGIRRGLAPLDELAGTIAQRGWGDLRTVGTERVPNEVTPLVRSLNNLMSRLSAAHSAQQRFISEAAHQLRTPLAGLTAQIERAMQAADINAIKPALHQIQSSSSRVARLVHQLLTLARAEPGSDPQHDLVRLDLSKLVQETCREWVPEALAKGVDLGFAGVTEPVYVMGHELLLAELLNNLIHNGLLYGARPGGSITVRLSHEPRLEICVEDDGPGIPADERVRIFERFHRVPGSVPGGCGLGLTIVKQIAAVHGAEVHADVGTSGRGAAFRVVFSEVSIEAPAVAA